MHMRSRGASRLPVQRLVLRGGVPSDILHQQPSPNMLLWSSDCENRMASHACELSERCSGSARPERYHMGTVYERQTSIVCLFGLMNRLPLCKAGMRLCSAAGLHGMIHGLRDGPSRFPAPKSTIPCLAIDHHPTVLFCGPILHSHSRGSAGKRTTDPSSGSGTCRTRMGGGKLRRTACVNTCSSRGHFDIRKS